MSKIYAQFLAAAGALGNAQLILLRMAHQIFTEDELKYLAPTLKIGTDNWEARVFEAMYDRTNFLFEQTEKGSAQAPQIANLKSPLLRTYNCLKCGTAINSIQPHGACCWGQPECPSCNFSLHTPDCSSIPRASSKPEERP